MITVLSLTQFAFVALAIASLKILHHSGTALTPFFQALEPYSPYLLLVPVLWTGFAFGCLALNRGPFRASVARILGVIVAIGSFLLLVSVTYFSSAG